MMRHTTFAAVGSAVLLAACAAFSPGSDLEGDSGGAVGSGGQTSGTSTAASGGFDDSGSSGVGAGGPSKPIEQEICDDGLHLADNDPLAAARAIELCKMSAGPDDWGVVSADWVMPDGAAAPSSSSFHLGHGIMSRYGSVLAPQTGAHMLALSSGAARAPGDQDYQSPEGYDKEYGGNHPQGYPKETPSCPGTITGELRDGVALEVVMRPPPTATGLAFDIYFFTYEWPEYVCDAYNDYFLALLSPKVPMLPDENISFDSQGNAISVNAAACLGGPPCSAGGKSFGCAKGAGDLLGTGFGGDHDWAGVDHAGTGWLVTQAPVAAGDEVRLRFAIYDSADGVLDSTTIVDNFRWIADEDPPTETVPNPK